MKITVNVDCTPEEARTFLGLPDVQPMQEELLRELQDRMMANIRAMDPEELMKMWMPASIKGWEQFGKMFAKMMGSAKRG